MAQDDELAKVKARIKALSEKTVENGCSEHEALVAMGKVGALLDQYNLSMSEIDVREAKCLQITIQTDEKRRGSEMWQVFGTIARFCACKTWHTKNAVSGSRYNFFGHEADAQMAEYLFRLIRAAIDTEATAFRRTSTYRAATSKRASTLSFKTGMAQRIAIRLDEMQVAAKAEADQRERERLDAARDAAEAAFTAANPARVAEVEAILKRQARGETLEVDAFRTLTTFDTDVAVARQRAVGGTALIALKGQLVEQEYDALGLKLKTRSFRGSTRDALAYSRGTIAGNRVNLTRPVADGRATTAGLLS